MLRQDTAMYKARASASESMLHRMRALEGGKASCAVDGNKSRVF